MAHRTIKQTVATTAVREGAGVMVRRTIGTRRCRQLDPFLMLDHFSSEDPNDYIDGFPDHPHPRLQYLHLHAGRPHVAQRQHGVTAATCAAARASG